MNKSVQFLGLGLLIFGMVNCKSEPKENKVQEKAAAKVEETAQVVEHTILNEKPEGVTAPDGMVWVSGATFKQGAVDADKAAMDHEKPAVEVIVDGFFMDATEVTNAQFAAFVKATGYVTVAEKGIDWEELKKQVPAGTEKPHDSI